MSKAKSSRDRRIAPSGVARVTRSSINPQDSQRTKPTDSGLVDDLSLMSVSEQQASLARKGKSHQTSSPSTKAVLSSPSGSSVPRGALGTIGRLMKLGRVRNIVVVAGAGISTASGIPDFRTPGTGLYANLAKYDIPYPEAIFNIDYFSDNPHPFFSLAKELYPGHHRPNYVHYFIRMLHQKGLLLRMYTQNIDGLEKLCGIPDDKLVEAHGSFATAACHLCYTPYPAEEAKQAIMNGNVPICTFCAGAVKPNVVFFGEDLPEKYFQHAEDFPKADLLMIMGTSLKIEPFASLVNTVKSTVPRLLLNRDPVGPFERRPLRRCDYMELGDLSDSVRKLAEILGWHTEIQDLMNSHENGLCSYTDPSNSSGDNSDSSETDSMH
ncbi:NAD-dependent protein deacetylase sirtuin-3, mitochondrial [Labeo rohita]|uniref:NAD-dependent protein deacetylase sirtuin-3, mitochondrial n=1 Tax=Labeo rohita TaxID=84645 RepID=A0ABQ8LS50_LABRO|nr:NAD-dependent protein deacetylase sirtuin-3 isoform X2 [Labeo rohita]KAI2653469.1 NAD-dependent protein deacetylase sirtuin-3, mitochondrial [Labeo rohita]